MEKVLIITFDLIKRGEPKTPLSVGYLLSYLKNHDEFRKQFIVDHISFDLYANPNLSPKSIIKKLTKTYNIKSFDDIAIGCYIWSDHITNPLINLLRRVGYKNRIILGGNQISDVNNLKKNYPDCQCFIMGYGEEALLEAILSDEKESSMIINKPPDISSIPSPYLSNEIKVAYGQEKVRIETKRGCPYKCSFCAHRDLQNQLVNYHDEAVVYEELKYLKRKNVKKINIVDPTFNTGKNYNKIIKMCIDLDIKSKISIQTRLNDLFGSEGQKLIELSSSLDIYFEFGLQSIHEKELQVLNRVNDAKFAGKAIEMLNKKNMSYEFTLLYGIPYQNYLSFKQSIDFLKENGCKSIKAFPLNLLRGTQLWKQRHTWKFKEGNVGNYKIPTVVGCTTFSIKEWKKMHELAKSL